MDLDSGPSSLGLVLLSVCQEEHDRLVTPSCSDERVVSAKDTSFDSTRRLGVNRKGDGGNCHDNLDEDNRGVSGVDRNMGDADGVVEQLLCWLLLPLPLMLAVVVVVPAEVVVVVVVVWRLGNCCCL